MWWYNQQQCGFTDYKNWRQRWWWFARNRSCIYWVVFWFFLMFWNRYSILSCTFWYIRWIYRVRDDWNKVITILRWRTLDGELYIHLVSLYVQWVYFFFLLLYHLYRNIDYLNISIESFGINQYILLIFTHLVEAHQQQRNILHNNYGFTNYQCIGLQTQWWFTCNVLNRFEKQYLWLT